MEPQEPEDKLSDPRTWTTTPESEVSAKAATESSQLSTEDEADAKRREIRRRRLEGAVTPQGVAGPPFGGYRLMRSPIDWRLWLNLSQVELWQACLLSMNVNPVDVKRWTDADGREHFQSSGITDSATSREYDTRASLLADQRDNPEHFTPPDSIDARSRVRLREFAAWLSGIGFDLPAELATEARRPNEQLAKTDLPLQAEQRAEETARKPATGKRWSETELRNLATYRDKHGTEATARKFNISGARVRALLPKKDPQPTAHNPFGSGRRK
jgi:hypothetical protein